VWGEFPKMGGAESPTLPSIVIAGSKQEAHRGMVVAVLLSQKAVHHMSTPRRIWRPSLFATSEAIMKTKSLKIIFRHIQ